MPSTLTPPSPPAAPPRALAGILLLALPACVYLAVLSVQVTNIPTSDDYFALFDYLARWEDPARAGGGSLGLLFEQFYSHRIPFTHLGVVGLNAILGHCDLRVLAALSWIGWVLLPASLIWSRWPARASVLGLLPVCLLLMHPQGQTNLLTATGSPGHAWTLLLAFWAFHFSRTISPASQAAALVLAASSALCTANGLLVFPVVALSALFRRQWRLGSGWLVAAAVAWGWYLWGYSVAAQPFVHHGFSPWALVANAAVMTGAIVNFGTINPGVVLVAGLALLLGAVLAWWTDRRDQAHGSGSFLLFLLLSIAMTAYARVGWTSDYMLQDRYRFYGLLILCLLYLRVADLLAPARRRVLVAAALPAAFCFCFLAYAQTWADMLFVRRWAEATAMNLAFDRPLPMPSAPEQAVDAGRILQSALAHGWLRLPRLLEPGQVQQLRALPQSGPSPGGTWQCVESSAVSGYLLEPPEGQPPAPAPDFAVIFQGDSPLILPVLVPRARFAEIPARRSFLGAGYKFILPASAYLPGRHTVYALKRQADHTLEPLWAMVVTCP